jgi:AbrB family looped-hinge helix DNA binding protein
MVETITVSSKGQITIPSKIRKELRIEKGGKFLVFREGDSIRITPVPKLSKLAGIDEQVFKGRKPSKEIETVRKEWTKEFEKHIIKQRIILDTRPLVRLLPKEAGRSTDIRRDRS